MAAMEAADGSRRRQPLHLPAVADRRLEAGDSVRRRRPRTSSYILMAEKTDTNGDSHNNGKYAMYINVSQPAPDRPKGIKEGENLNPVKTLRMRYDAWRKLQPASFK